MTLPTYSLLKKHDDVLSYRVPDPTGETAAWVRIGLFPWQLEGERPVKTGDPDKDGFKTIIERAEGVGLRVKFNKPSPFHPKPKGYEEAVEDTFETFSTGSGKRGRHFRLQNVEPKELRQMGRWIALYGFSVWWWVEEHTEYPLGMHGTREEMQTPVPETVLEDGTVVEASGDVYESPYSLDDMELLTPDEWQTPYEEAKEAITDVVEGLNDVPALTVRDALRDVVDEIETPRAEKTEAKKKKERLENVLRGCDGVGHRIQNRLTSEFDSVEGLCEDIRCGGERLRSMTNIGESREEAIIDALREAGEWKPENE